MPKPTSISAYPPDYLELLEAAIRSTEPIVLHLTSHTEAASVRFDLYGLRAAAVKEGYPHAGTFKQLKFLLSGSELTILPITAPSAIRNFLAGSQTAQLPTPEQPLTANESFQDFLSYELDDTEPTTHTPSNGLLSTLSSLGFTLGAVTGDGAARDEGNPDENSG